MLYEEESGDIEMILTGDSLISRRMSVFREERFLKMVDLLRSGDITFTNAEMTFHNYEDSPTLTPGGGYTRADPQMIVELEWLGIDMVACANNHAYDFGENGVLSNIQYLDEAGMPHAGTGRTLAEARGPTYVDTPKGRVALVSATSTAPSVALAGDQWRDTMGRPGVNLIRALTQYTVDRNTFDALRNLNNNIHAAGADDSLTRGNLARRPALGWEVGSLEDNDTQFFLPDLHPWSQYPEPAGAMIALGEQFGRRLIPLADDIEGNLQRIRDARRMADWVIVTMHDHDNGLTLDDPSDVAVAFARAAIDAGADVFAGHGPHVDRGIEVYKGRPIFYSLGHLVHQSDTVLWMPRDNMVRAGLGWEATTSDFFDWRSGREHLGEWKDGMGAEPFRWRNAIASVSFKAKKLSEVRLIPIDLGFKRPRYQRGRPLLAEGEEAREVLSLFQRLSAPFGTNIEIEGDVGVVRLD